MGLSKRIGQLAAIGLAILLLVACSGSTEGRSTDTRSTDLSTEAEQIAFLGRYVIMKSAVSETEFHIVFHDNSGGLVPGPSDWDIQAVMKVDDVVPWIDGKATVGTADFSWAEVIVMEGLRPSSQPLYYSNSTTSIAVYEPENIIFFHSTSTP